MEDRLITFGTLNEDGSLSNVRYLDQAKINGCPFYIMVAEHYRADGSCKCDDAEHRAMMIREWDYEPSQFDGIPLREVPS